MYPESGRSAYGQPRSLRRVTGEPLRIEIEALVGPFDHGLGCLHLRLVDAGRSLHVHDDGVIDHALYVEVREQAGREASPTTAIIDSQSAKGAVKGGLRSTRPAMTPARSSLAASATS